jgi:hypothetical protein
MIGLPVEILRCRSSFVCLAGHYSNIRTCTKKNEDGTQDNQYKFSVNDTPDAMGQSQRANKEGIYFLISMSIFTTAAVSYIFAATAA